MIIMAGAVLLGVVGAVVLTGVSAGIWVGARLHNKITSEVDSVGEVKQIPESTVLAEFGGLRLLRVTRLTGLQDKERVVLVEESRSTRRGKLFKSIREYISNGEFRWYYADNGGSAPSEMDRRINGLLAVYYTNKDKSDDSLRHV